MQRQVLVLKSDQKKDSICDNKITLYWNKSSKIDGNIFPVLSAAEWMKIDRNPARSLRILPTISVPHLAGLRSGAKKGSRGGGKSSLAAKKGSSIEIFHTRQNKFTRQKKNSHREKTHKRFRPELQLYYNYIWNC